MGLSSCGVRKGAPEWIGSDAAVVRCTVAGPNLRLPPLFDELPSPTVATGLFARTMDPVALDELGYERDRVVCATLQAPDAASLDAAEDSIDSLIKTRNDVAKRAREFGRCRCSYADALDARALVVGCVDAPTRLRCELEPEQLEAFAELLAPLEAKLATTELPRVHWRLSGRSDRRGRFAARHDDLLGRHLGGSDVYLRSSPLPPFPGTKLIAGLLAVDHVVAVVRQDSGRGLVVVREIDDQLILDHFGYPDWLGTGARSVDVEMLALLAYLDDAQLDRYRRALEPPAQTRELLFDPRDGYLVELDRAALERVDRGLLLSSYFVGQHYDEAEETRTLPPVLVDRFAHQVPFGTEGTALHAKARLTDEGRQWLAGVEGLAASEALTSLGQLELTPSFEPAVAAGVGQLFLLRGQPIEQLSFAGASALPLLLSAIEAAAPGSVEGGIDDFEVAVPSGPMPGQFDSRSGIEALRERLSKTPHELEVELVDGGKVVALELRPR